MDSRRARSKGRGVNFFFVFVFPTYLCYFHLYRNLFSFLFHCSGILFQMSIAKMGSLGIESNPLQVAIVGTGIAGLTAAVALRQHPHINVTLYEKATELKEIGASITLGPNGLRTLQKLGLEDCISDKVGYRGPNPISRFYRHW